MRASATVAIVATLLVACGQPSETTDSTDTQDESPPQLLNSADDEHAPTEQALNAHWESIRNSERRSWCENHDDETHTLTMADEYVSDLADQRVLEGMDIEHARATFVSVYTELCDTITFES